MELTGLIIRAIGTGFLVSCFLTACGFVVVTEIKNIIDIWREEKTIQKIKGQLVRFIDWLDDYFSSKD